jgi:dihydrofolate reductase
MTVPIVLIVAVAENGVIGVDGKLPWRLKSDLQTFRALTMGKPVIMGRKTLDEIGRVLDGRDVIVVSRRPGYQVPGALVAADLDAAVAIAAEKAAQRGVDEIVVAGGGDIFRQAMPLADRLRVTQIAGKPRGDVYFPDIAPADWVEVERSPLPASEGDTATGVHVTYQRRR